MIVTETKIRVYYEDTDQMGVVYYGNYARYYEIGRTEMIRDLGFTYQTDGRNEYHASGTEV